MAMDKVFRGVLFVLVIALFVKQRRFRQRDTPFPPGPTGLPFLGAVLSIDISKPWVTYFQWRKLFGDVIYTRIFNMDVLVLNSAKVARDLIEFRSGIYSDRPKFATAEPYGIADGTILMPYGDTWRLHRRIYHQAMNTEASLSYRPMQFAKARQLIINLIDNPQQFSTHIHAYSTSIIMSIVYGYDTAPKDDPYVEYAEKGTRVIAKAADSKRAALLGICPFLLVLPTWIPGSFKAEAAEAKSYATGFRTILFGMAVERMRSGTDVPSMISDAIRRNEINGNVPEVTLAIRNTSSVAYGAGSETTSACLDVFVLAMVLFPEVQRRAQEEIYAVVGSDRLPDFSDRASLPFVQAVLQETLRWHPVVPLGLPHATTTEDVYEGSYIPEGTTVLVNVWGLAHEEEVYPEPYQFKPERFMKQGSPITESNPLFIFGIGRRICPGRHVAMASIWIAIAMMLATLDFSKAEDEHGNEIDFLPEFTTGATSNQQTTQTLSVSNSSTDVLQNSQGNATQKHHMIAHEVILTFQAGLRASIITSSDVGIFICIVWFVFFRFKLVE